MRTLSRPRIGRRWSHAAVFALSALFGLAGVSADAVVPGTDPTAFARNANLARGLSELSRPFGPDRLNLFNGNLTLALPIGDGYPVSSHFSYELVLAYNSLAWDFEEATAGAGAPVAAQPTAASNAGFGWDLSLGRLLAPGVPGNPDPTWAYVGPDGRRHLFYGSLNDGAVVEPGALYSRDGSYLRLDSEDASTRVLRHPDGRYRRFVEANGEWRIDRFGDHRGAYVDASWSPDGLTW
ncbi:MAG TPA: hypothetical protein VKU40_02800, partial [Thermoanaerobaculia bacterium]|nr:hypothetical protein [Thermoanaerobaculia bacterium]